MVTYLLDTSTFLWAAAEPRQLSPKARRICESHKGALAVSAVSLWEIMIKCANGNLRIADPVGSLPAWLGELGASVLPVQAAHVYGLRQLAPLHRDPFDRMLVAQAVVEEMPILTRDEIIHRYPARCIW